MRKLIGSGVVLLVMLAGCQATGVGDPCTPEQVPTDGFRSGEAYLETSSVQCRTRTCIVFGLDGDPNFPRTINGGAPNPDCPNGTRQVVDPATGQTVQVICPPEDVVEERVYCTCRCAAPADSDAPTCECDEGFRCEPILDESFAGSEGFVGSYCVRDLGGETPDP